MRTEHLGRSLTSEALSSVHLFHYQCVRYLEYIEGEPTKGCSPLLVQAFLYTCYIAMGLEMKASRRLLTLREAFNDEYTAGRM